jgi:aspartyl-tRNA(Asn)/glutamyl-tRNA(Gln) amidotransferase subunit B
MNPSQLQTVIGLEIHVQLATRTKMFCSCPFDYTAAANSNICPVCLGHPGALPTVNKQAIELALRCALACESQLQHQSTWARKNYFYPDLPKGYQITQYHRPLSRGGSITFNTTLGFREVSLERMHLEEDAGKLVHSGDESQGGSRVDLNRCGVPLLEIVTDPVLNEPAEAREFLMALRQILKFTGASSCEMHKGELRVDANISLCPGGDPALGTKTEIKNLNSFSGVMSALEQERQRQRCLLDAGEPVRSVTLLWDERAGRLQIMREKEGSSDYRYFPEPDLPDLFVSPDQIAGITASLPELPREKRVRFQRDFGLNDYLSGLLSTDADLADYFERVAVNARNPELAANFITSRVMHLCRKGSVPIADSPIPPEALAVLINHLSAGRVSGSQAATILELMWDNGKDADTIISREGIELLGDEEQLLIWIHQALAAAPEKVADYRRGREGLLNYFIGQLMAKTKGSADPSLLHELLIRELREETENDV